MKVFQGGPFVIFIAYDLCEGCGACAETFPLLFEMRDDVAWVINPDKFVPEEFDVIVACCPFRAISAE